MKHQYTHLLSKLNANSNINDKLSVAQANLFLKEWYELCSDPDMKKIIKTIKSSDYFYVPLKYQEHKSCLPLGYMTREWINWITPEIECDEYQYELHDCINQINYINKDTFNNRTTIICNCNKQVFNTEDNEDGGQITCGYNIVTCEVHIPLELIQLANEVDSLKTTLTSFLYIIHDFSIVELNNFNAIEQSFNIKYQNFIQSLSTVEKLCMKRIIK